MRKLNFYFLFLVLAFLTSCRTDDIIVRQEVVEGLPSENTAIKGFYMLNEGNMGSNKCTLDFFDYTKEPITGISMRKSTRM